jgi:hypothetical protein
MNIKLVKLKNNGFHGIECQYYIEEVKGTRKSNTLIKKYPKDPIHKDLENLFKDLREHLLDVCDIAPGIDEKDKMFLIHECEVTGVEFDSEGFILHGHRQVFGNKKVVLNTPKVEEIDNYHKYEEVMDIIRQIAAETKLYLEGEKKVSDEELVQRWVESNKDKKMSVEEFNNMPEDGRREYFTRVLEEEFGAIILHQGDVSTGDDPVVEFQTEFTMGGNDEEIVVPVEKPKKEKKVKTEAHSPNEAV